MTTNGDNETIYNKDELNAPEWLNNKKYFEEVLKKHEGNAKIEILDLKSSPASLKGDHYASVMFRFEVKYLCNREMKTKSLIVKTTPESEGYKQDFMKDTKLFETEIGMYSDVLPRIQSDLRAAGDNMIIAPKCLYYSLSPKKVIVFEDLRPLGFTVLGKRDISKEEVYEAFTKLAKYHAASYKILAEDPKFFENYRYGLYSMSNFMEDPAMVNGCKSFIKMLESQPDLVKYKPYFEALDKVLLKKCIELSQEYRSNPQKNSLYTLCHGDFHARNMMFKHDADEKKLQELLLIDFQMSNICPMAYDISYSFFLILTPDMRANQFDEILYHYFTTFKETLNKLNFKGTIPTLIDLKKHLMDYRHFEIFLFITALAFTYEMNTGSADIEKMLTNEEFRENLYMQEPFIMEVRKLLPKYLHAGYLDELIL